MLDDSSIFVLTNDLNILSIAFKEPISQEELEARDFYSFVVVATHPTSGTAETAVLISVPKKICEGTPITQGIHNTTTITTYSEYSSHFNENIKIINLNETTAEYSTHCHENNENLNLNETTENFCT